MTAPTPRLAELQAYFDNPRRVARLVALGLPPDVARQAVREVADEMRALVLAEVDDWRRDLFGPDTAERRGGTCEACRRRHRQNLDRQAAFRARRVAARSQEAVTCAS